MHLLMNSSKNLSISYYQIFNKSNRDISCSKSVNEMVDSGLVSCNLLFSQLLSRKKRIGSRIEILTHYALLKILANEYGKELLYLFQSTYEEKTLGNNIHPVQPVFVSKRNNNLSIEHTGM